MAKKIISLDELAYFKSLLADVAISGDYDDLEGKPLWIGTQDEYNTEASSIPTDTVIIITDDNGAVISINYVDLTNKPQINGVTLIGNKTGSDLGLVNAETGKGLSSNDYTANEKSKLAGIASGAQANVIEAISVNGVAQTISNKNVDITVSAQVNSDWNATSGVAQIINKPDLGTAAAKNSTSAVTASSTDLVESGAVKSAIDAAVSSSYHHAGTSTVAGLTSSLLVAANEGNVYNITDSGTTTSDFIEGAGKPINSGDNVGIAKVAADTYKFDLLSGFIDTSAFIEKSATSGLVKNDGSIDATAYAKQSEMSVTAGTGADADKTTIQLKSGTSATVLVSHQDISGKVDKVTGKGLSTEDYTTAEKTKLDGIEANADVNVIESISLGGTEQVVTNKNVDLQAATYDQFAKAFGRDVVATLISGSDNQTHGYLYSDGCDLITPHLGFLQGYYGMFASRLSYDDPTYAYKDSITSVVMPYGTEYTTAVCTGFRSLSYVVLPSTLKAILYESFLWCLSLREINIPNGVIEIGESVFRGSGLRNITIPKSVTIFGTNVFDLCNSLTDIYYAGTQTEWEAIEGLSGAGIPSSCTIHYEYEV